MTTINQELYEALIAAGAPDDIAKRAAANVLSHDQRTDLATKADLAELKAEIQAMLNRQLQVMAGLMVAMTGIFAAIVKLF
jgi:hypothetical protein